MSFFSKFFASINSKSWFSTSLFWLGIILLAALGHWYHFVNADEGVILDGAWRITLGEVPYRDFFEFITPGSFYLVAIFFKVFGVSYWGAKVGSLFMLGFSVIGVNKLARFFVNDRRWIFLVSAAWVILTYFYPLINHNFFSLVPFIWAVYFYLRATEMVKRPAALKFFSDEMCFFIAGLLTAVTFLFLQTRGLALWLGVILSELIIFRRFRLTTIYFLPGFLFGLSPLLVWPLADLVDYWLLFPSEYYVAVNHVSFLPSFLWLLLYAIVLIIFWRQRVEKKIWAMLIISWLLHISTLTRPDLNHLILNSIFLVVIVVVFLSRACIGINFKKNFQILTFLVIFYVVFFGYWPYQMLWYEFLPHWRTVGWQGYVRLENPILDEVATAIYKYTEPDDFIYSGPFLPNIYFEARRLNPLPDFYMVTGQQPISRFAEAKKMLVAKNVYLAVLNYPLVEKYRHDRNNPLDNYLAEEFEILKVIGNVEIRLKKTVEVEKNL